VLTRLARLARLNDSESGIGMSHAWLGARKFPTVTANSPRAPHFTLWSPLHLPSRRQQNQHTRLLWNYSEIPSSTSDQFQAFRSTYAAP
jgi:hypothetical protein